MPYMRKLLRIEAASKNDLNVKRVSRDEAVSELGLRARTKDHSEGKEFKGIFEGKVSDQ